jgi:hypothetical protein
MSTAFTTHRDRHPEVTASSRASKGDGPDLAAREGPFILRGSLRSHLRMAVNDWVPLTSARRKKP